MAASVAPLSVTPPRAENTGVVVDRHVLLVPAHNTRIKKRNGGASIRAVHFGCAWAIRNYPLAVHGGGARALAVTGSNRQTRLCRSFRFADPHGMPRGCATHPGHIASRMTGSTTGLLVTAAWLQWILRARSPSTTSFCGKCGSIIVSTSTSTDPEGAAAFSSAPSTLSSPISFASFVLRFFGVRSSTATGSSESTLVEICRRDMTNTNRKGHRLTELIRANRKSDGRLPVPSRASFVKRMGTYPVQANPKAKRSFGQT